MSSFVHHYKSISEFKLELQSGNTRFGSKSAICVSRVTLKFDGWPWKIMGQLFHTISSFVHNFKAIDEFKHTLQSRSAQFGSKSAIICPVWPSNLTEDLENNRASLLYYIKLCTSFQNHWWIDSGITVPKRSIRVKIGDFFNNRAYLLWCFKLFASLHRHMRIQTGVAIQKRIDGVFTSVTLTFDIWPWPFARTSLLPLLITPKISWWYDDRINVKKGVTGGWTDGRADGRTELCLKLLGLSEKSFPNIHWGFRYCFMF